MKRLIIVLTAVVFLISLTSCSKAYTVNYVSDEITVHTESVKKGEKVNAFSITKEGYELVGWYLDNNQFDFSTEVNKSITLVAEWIKIETKSNISYVLGGGINEVNAPTEYIEGVGLSLLPTPSKDGYTFMGWYIGDTKQLSISTSITGDVTLTAKWEAIDKTLTIVSGKALINVDGSTYIEITDYLDPSLFTISLSNDCVSVDESLFVTGLNVGICTITVTSKTDSTLSGQIQIEVIEKKPIIATVSNKLAMNNKTYFWIKNIDELSESSLSDFTWTINDSTIASINDSEFSLSGIKTGNITLTATSKNDSRVSATYSISVVDPDSSAVLGTDNAKYEYYIGEMFDLYLLGSTYSMSNFTWNSSNTEILRVLESGQIIGVQKGTTSINVYEKNNPTNRASFNITINEGGNVDYVGNLITTALSQLGYHEDEGNYTKYGEWYNLNPGAWCAMFVSWCWYQTGLSNEVMVKYCSCSAGQEWSIEKGIFHYKEDYTPKSGDIIFFTSSGMSHTGICAYVDENYMYTVEGNSSDKVGIWRWSLKDARITGYASPEYPTFVGTSKDFSYLAGKDANGNYYWTNVTEKQPVL